MTLVRTKSTALINKKADGQYFADTRGGHDL